MASASAADSAAGFHSFYRPTALCFVVKSGKFSAFSFELVDLRKEVH